MPDGFASPELPADLRRRVDRLAGIGRLAGTPAAAEIGPDFARRIEDEARALRPELEAHEAEIQRLRRIDALLSAAARLRDEPTEENIRAILDTANAVVRGGDPPLGPSLGAADIFATRPPVPWLAPELQWCPGRPSALVAYGGTGKTLIAQAAAVAVMLGRPIWGWFRSVESRILHIDYDQGQRATLDRYERLARGMGLDEKAISNKVTIKSRPKVWLTSSGAADEFAMASDGYGLAIIDAWRGAIRGEDENDSKTRDYADMLAEISERNGCTFLVLVHASKGGTGKAGEERDRRTRARGTSALYDASGSWLDMERRDGALYVTMEKGAAEACGGQAEPFYLAIEDVPIGDDPKAGVKVVHRTVEQVRPAPKAGDRIEGLLRRAVEYIAAENGKGLAVHGKAAIKAALKCDGGIAGTVVDMAIERRMVENRGTDSKPRLWVTSPSPA